MFPVALVLLALVFGIATPAPGNGCAMAMDSAPSGSLAAPDCCTDRSCPRMAAEPSRPEAMITTTAAVPALSVVGVVRLSPTMLPPLVTSPHRIVRDDHGSPPLRI